MRPIRCAALSLVGALLAGSGAAPASAPVHATAAAPDAVAVAAANQPVYAPALDHAAIHSKADARSVANQALDLVSLPAGSVRLGAQPAGAPPVTGLPSGIQTQVAVTRWESVPGSVPDAEAWLVAHSAAGTSVFRQIGGDESFSWTTARPDHELPFTLEAWLATDGDHVYVTLSATVTWTPNKTAVETIPASLRAALLDYSGDINTFGTDSRHVVTGTDLDQLRKTINALDTAPAGVPPCPAYVGDLTTLTMSYGGHVVVMHLGDKCGETEVLSDGRQQPALNSPPYSIAYLLADAATSAPATDVTPTALLADVFAKPAAMRRAGTLSQLVALPPDAHVLAPTSAERSQKNVAVRSRSVVWAGTVSSAVDYLTTHVPHGFVMAHIGHSDPVTSQVILQPAHVYPASSLISIEIHRQASRVVLSIDGEAIWVTPRSRLELIPSVNSGARVTILPLQRPSRRTVLTGKDAATLTQALDSRGAARPYPWCAATPRTQLLKLEVAYRVGKHLVIFYWYNGDCTVGVLVDGRRSVPLADPPTALVERLLHWK